MTDPITVPRAVVQQALEAWEQINKYGFVLADYEGPMEQAITAFKAALEQPERAQAMRDAGYTRRPTLREMAEPEQEPVAWIQPDHLQKARRAPFLCRVEPTKRMSDFVPIYTHPPRREWRSLSKEEFGYIYVRSATHEEFARAVEAALRSKNHE